MTNKSNKEYIFNQIYGFISGMRIKQWTKNLLVFAAFLYSIGHVSISQFFSSCIAFILFCLTSSSIYMVNDFFDREADRIHPEKCKRPMASGILDPHVGLSGAIILFVVSISIGISLLNKYFVILLVAYLVNNMLYSYKLKHVVIIDIMSIAFGFVLRAIGGGLAITVPMTPWFLLCTLLLALFLAIGKRRHELNILQDENFNHRIVLQDYNEKLLDQLSSIVTAATIMCYALYTFTAGKPVELMYTVPLVIYGMFRYLFLIHVKSAGGAPEKILLKDKHILATVVIYCVMIILILMK